MRTYGEIILRRGPAGEFFWIKAEPQVAMRLRRLFDGATRSDENHVIIRASDAASHDLEWFMQRYPLVTHGDDIAERSARHQAMLERVAETRRPDYKPPSFELAIPAREYQAVGADQIVRTGGTLIADDLGLGKTVTLICAMLSGEGLPAVVVTLTHLCNQWAKMIKQFAPALKTHVVNRGTPYDLADISFTVAGDGGKRRIVKNGIRRMPDVVILNYHKLHKWAERLVEYGPKFVAFDEIQELRKGAGSGSKVIQKGEAAIALSACARLRAGASATPIYNYGAEIYEVINVLRPQLLGSKEEFLREWCEGPHDKARVVDPPALRAFLLETGAMLRRTRKDVGRELPPMQRVWMTVETDPEKLKDISESVAELARTVLKVDTDPFAKFRAAGELDYQLRQATGLAKARGVVDFVTMAYEGTRERILLYGHHHLVYDAWEEGLAKNGLRVARYTGAESDKQKEQSIQRFISGDAQVLMMANRAGAGVDGLQFHCNTSVVGELDWSPGVHLQGEGRLDRDGQVNPVTSYYLVAEDGSDPVIEEVLGLKNAQRAGIVDGALGASSQADDVAEGESRMKRLAMQYLKARGLA